MRGLARGQVWWADLDKVRPVVLLTRDAVVERLTHVLVAPVTSIVRDIPVDVSLGAQEGVAPGSVLNLDNVQLLHVQRLVARAGAVDAERWPEVCDAMAHAIGCGR